MGNGSPDSETKRPNRLAGTNLKEKDLVGIPWSVAFALRDQGWRLRQDIIWAKPNPMPESVSDRCTKSHEYIFMFSKSKDYFWDATAIAEPCEKIGTPAHLAAGKNSYQNVSHVPSRSGNKKRKAATERGCPKDGVAGSIPWEGYQRNKRDVWTIGVEPYPDAHFATFPPEIPSLCIRAGSKPGDLVLDPFAGSGTTLEVAESLGRAWVGYELNEGYRPLIEARLQQRSLFGAEA
jgi:DNA modification methylase